MNSSIFGHKLAHYASRKPKRFLQLDGFHMPDGGDDIIMCPDQDGDALKVSGTVELMYGATVRVLIPYDTDPKVAVRQLKKLAKLFKRDPSLIEFAKPMPEKPFQDDFPF